MDTEWNDSQPIYRQLRDRVVHMILDGTLKEGDALPSVRTVASDYRVNPLTVPSGYCVAEWLPQMIAFLITVVCAPVFSESCDSARL